MYAFFLDIDGTIYNGSISEKLSDTMRRGQDLGYKFFINTARHYHSAVTAVSNLPLDGIIASFGQTVFTEGDFAKKEIMPFDEVVKVAECAFRNKLILGLIGEDIRLNINCEGKGGTPVNSAEDIINRYKNIKISKFVAYGNPDETMPYFKDSYDIVNCNKYIECIKKGYSKKSGIEFIESYYNIPHENTVAIGDTLPDLDMLDYAAYGIAMGNGDKELKKRSRYITRSIDEDGVSFAIECFIKGEAEKLRADR